MDNNLEQVASYYEQMTEPYLKYGGQVFGWHFGLWDNSVSSPGDALLRSNQIITEYCDLHPGQLVLDAGCGVGGLAFYLAQTFDVNVIGITLCQHHVEMASQFARERGLHHKVEFRLQDFMKLDFSEDSFDFAFNQETFCYALNKEDYLRNIYILNSISAFRWYIFYLSTGADNILFAADYPYESNQQAVRFMDAVGICSSDKEKIYHLNAEILFRI